MARVVEDGRSGRKNGRGFYAYDGRRKRPDESVYALLPDLEARAIADRVIDGVTTVGYDGFVDLVADYPTNQSWL